MKKIFWPVLVAGGIVAVGALLSQLLVVRRVDCWLADHELSPDFPVCAQLRQLVGSRLLLRDFQRDKTTAELLLINETKEAFDINRVTKSLNGTVTFYLTDQPPLYRLQAGEELVLVTARGERREDNPALAVPLVTDQAGLINEQPSRQDFLIAFLRQLGEKRTEIKQISLISPTRIELTIANFPTVLLVWQQDPELAARQLQIILSKLKPNEIDLALEELDLRFALPVLRTNSSDDLLISTESAEASDSAQTLIDSQE